MNLKKRKVLLVGLGILGGSLAIADFLLKKGAKLIITDLKNRKDLRESLKKLRDKRIKFILGKHRAIDFKNNDIIVFNPAVSISSPWVKLAKKYKKLIENDLSLFLKDKKTEYIAVTGTRGKTTVAHWINHFLPNSFLGGNIPEKGLLKIANKKAKLFVLELSSFQLEFMKKELQPPKVAIITNLYNDHLNRYGNFKNYLNQKAKIFLNQTKDDFLILNADNKYTSRFLKKKPKSKVYYFSLKKLLRGKNGLFITGSRIYFQENAHISAIADKRAISDWADFQKANLLAALLAAYLFARDWKNLVKKIKTLPPVPFRQEIILRKKNLIIINDTAATSPDATLAALEKFKKYKKRLILIIGGTDKKLEFKALADKIKKYIKPENLYLLEGSATQKLIRELKEEELKIFSNLKEIIIDIAKEKRKSAIILFSPASASFEKFKNEFDRGKKFNKLVKRYFQVSE
ncbi:MAG: UDP-N-acetylmuramoyl-L-alanine--D-glutamate ligase [Patescibacteria group bacterium]